MPSSCRSSDASIPFLDLETRAYPDDSFAVLGVPELKAKLADSFHIGIGHLDRDAGAVLVTVVEEFVKGASPIARRCGRRHFIGTRRHARKLADTAPAVGWRVDGEPIAQFRAWLAEAIAADPLDPTAMTLATADGAGRPSARVVLLKGYDERGPIGLGEPPTVSPAAAISNAVANAIGVRVPFLPLTPDRVVAALGKGGM